MSYERIDDREIFDGAVRESHEYRYRAASHFVDHGDTVLDACCGTGYGKKILEQVPGITYIGIDKEPPSAYGFHTLDFEHIDVGREYDFITAFDAFIGLECIEHLDDMGVKHFVHLAKRAQKTIVVSTPIIPNSNPYHKQQFTKDDILRLFVERELWALHHYEEQNATYGIFIFKRI